MPDVASTQVSTQESADVRYSQLSQTTVQGLSAAPPPQRPLVQVRLEPAKKKTEQFYFGAWADDPKGERAMTDPVSGWLVRRDAIKAGIDSVRVQTGRAEMTLSELMAHFLSFKRNKVTSGELSLATLDGYLKEVFRRVGHLWK